jgi:hypothetical protein
MSRKFRKGDRVLVPGVVHDTDAEEGLVHVRIEEGHAGWVGPAHVAVSPAILIMKDPAPPQVGDLVIHKDNEEASFMVLAIDAESAWVKSAGNGLRSSVLLANLTVVRAA